MRKIAVIDDIRDETYKMIVPAGRTYGTEDVKAHDFRVTVDIPHLNSIESLKVIIELYRLQTERPYIMVMDTGSSPEVMDQLEEMRAPDVEIHYIRGHSYRNRSHPVSAAIDLAQGICRTEYLFHTHSDCFPRRRDLVESFMRMCNEKNPAVGYQMTSRHWVTSEWEKCIGHVCTITHMPTIHRIGATWSMERAFALGVVVDTGVGWPDTETTFGYCLEAAGIKPLFVGFEINFVRQKDDNIDHCRSFSGSKLYSLDHHEKAKVWMAEAMREAMERIMVWRGLATAAPVCPGLNDDGQNQSCLKSYSLGSPRCSS